MPLKKTLCVLLATLLCVGLLSGCWPALYDDSATPQITDSAANTPGQPAPRTPEPDTEEEPREHTKFSDMPYVRPDSQATIQAAEALTASLPSIQSVEELMPVFDEADALYSRYDTMYAIAMIRASMDRSDSYWSEEERVLLEGYPAINKASSELMLALYESKFKQPIEQEWDAYFFDHIESAYYTTDVTKPLFEREAALISEQKNRLALASIDYKGASYTYSQIYEMNDYDAWQEASILWYAAYNEEFAKRFIELVKVRNQISSALDFNSYAEFALRSEHKDYTPEMVQRFLDDIVEHLVPVYRQMHLAGRYFPRADISYKEYLDFLSDTFEKICPEMDEVLTVMQECGLHDMEPRAYKEQGAFTMYISDYDMPYLLGTFAGDLYSMTTMAHEFGHFYSDYVTMLEPSLTNDIAEIHSQALELFVANHYEDRFDYSLGYQMRYDILFNSLGTMVGQPYYTSMEMRIYALSPSELTVDTLNKIALEECKRFGMDNYFEAFSMYDWVTLPHIFERPFSTLAYATSESAAMQLWEISLTDEKAALEKYHALIYLEEDREFMGALKAAGLKTPFDSGRIQEIAQWAVKYLLEEDWE